MQTAPQQGWSTLREGSQYYLYRSVSHIPLSTLEAFIQRLQVCQNQHIAVPELVRMPDGEVYLREFRGQRSFEDFLQQNPTTSTKLFLIQQLVKLVRNLHTFVGTEHGDLHIDCLSIGLDEELVLGGIAPISSSDSLDLDSVRVIIRAILSNPHEQELCKELCTLNLSKINQRIKRELAAGDWDELLSDWTETVNNTTYEEPSDELSIEEPVVETTPSDLPSVEMVEDDSQWDFEDTEVVSASAFAELDDLDFLDDLNLDDLPSPSLIPTSPSDAPIENATLDIENEFDIEDLPTPELLEQSVTEEQSLDVLDEQEPNDDMEFDLENLMDNLDDDDPFAIDAIDEFDETEFFDIPTARVTIEDAKEAQVTPEKSDAVDVNVMNVPRVSKDDLTNNVFSQSSLLGTLDAPVSEPESMIDEDDADELDWFTDNTETMSEPIPSSSVTEPTVVEPSNGNETWIWVAGAAVVAGGVFAVLNRDTTPPPEVVIGNEDDKTEIVENEDNTEVATVTTEPIVTPTELTEQTDADTTVASNGSTEAASAQTEISAVKIAKPEISKSVVSTGTTKSAKNSTPFQSATATSKPAPAIKTVQDLPAPKKKSAPSISQTTSQKSPVIAKTAPAKSVTPEATKTVTAKSAPVKPTPPVAVKAPSKAAPLPAQQKSVVEEAKPVIAAQKTTPEQGTQNLIADLAKPEPVVQAPTTKPSVETIIEKDPTPAQPLIQQTDTKPDTSSQALTVVEETNVKETVVEEPVVQTEPEVLVPEPTVQPEPEMKPEPTTKEVVAEATVPSLDLNNLSGKAFSGKLSSEELNQLLSTPNTSPDFTRANAIALTQAQRSNDVQRIGESLDNLLSVDANTHKPVYLLAMAQYQFNAQNIDGAREYLLQAENNWQHIERDQLVILRAQRDNIVAHISYTTYLETGSEDSRLQSITQFRKVQREARRAKLTTMFERAEAKMQFLQRKAP